MRALLMAAMAAVPVFAADSLPATDAREIVRRSIERDQTNWMRAKDYTWISRETTRHLDSSGTAKSTESQAWETTVLFGRPYKKLIERNGKILPADEQRKEQEKLDRAGAKFERETPEERQRRIAEYMKNREKDREFLREIPDAFDFQLMGVDKIDGHDAWVISAHPKAGYQARHGDAKAFSKIEGKIWIDQAELQWVRIEAKTIQTISWGWCVARLDPGASLIFEQTRVNDEIWLPKRQVVNGSGRLVVMKKLSEQEETTWSDYRKFQVDSKVVSAR